MHRDSPINTKEPQQSSGDRHSIAHQFFADFLSAMRQSSEIQSMLNRYRQN